MNKYLIILLIPFLLLAKEREFTILFSGNNNGKYRDCGCPYENLGGLAQRKSVIDSLRATADNLLLLDTGDILNSFIKDDDRDKMVAEIYPLLDYDVVGIGDHELIAGLDFYKQRLFKKLPLISANLTFVDSVLNPPKYLIKELKNGLKIGITSLNYQSSLSPLIGNKSIHRDSVTVAKVAESLKKVLAEMKDSADFIVILAHLNQEGITKIIDGVDGYNLIIGGHNNPEYLFPRIINDKIHLQAGYGGETMGKINLKISDKKVIDYQYNQVKIQSDFYPENGQVVNILKKYGYR